ncbi:hypothetical protein [Acinetobacter tianfuensis]|uniref:Uncharacterized protein n=1 Tax=Acinetobacter tianfuensis TaxID=2419603 RepID=A0A3A8EFM3_9GAMM|nr:hypothetical protein [Acinetobacter tianfuensis]RKG33732.1 hypothetical protein D7V32_02725 [Acinetobacter tianfuensis]
MSEEKGIRLEFAQFGHFDSFEVIRSLTSMIGLADHELPAPIATGLKTMYYVDNNVVEGLTYYYKVCVRRGNLSFMSSEISCLASHLWSPIYLESDVWLDVADYSTVVHTNNRVSLLKDKSGNQRHVAQNVEANKPLYVADSKCIRSDGTTLQNLTGSFNDLEEIARNEYSYFIVATPRKISGGVPAQGNSGVAFFEQSYLVSAFLSIESTNSNWIAPTVSITADAIALTETRANYAPFNISRAHNIGKNKLMVSILRTPTLLQSGINGVYQAGAHSSQQVGGRNFSVLTQYTQNGRSIGDLHEVIIVRKAIDFATRQKLEGYLAHKWGLLDLLAPEHPYKVNLPYR